MGHLMFPKHHLGTGRAFKGPQSGSKRHDLGSISPQASPLDHQRLALTKLRQLPLGKVRQVEGRAAAQGVDAYLMGSSTLPRPVNPSDRPLTV